MYVISDFIVFYVLVSGHGSQLADDNGDEEDGWDECMSIFIFFSYHLIISYKGILTCDHEIIVDDVSFIPISVYSISIDPHPRL